MPRLRLISVSAGLAVVALTGCGDAPTSDTRGYTKAPLEVLGVFIESETRSEVREFATFNRPDGQRVAPAADTAGG